MRRKFTLNLTQPIYGWLSRRLRDCHLIQENSDSSREIRKLSLSLKSSHKEVEQNDFSSKIKCLAVQLGAKQALSALGLRKVRLNY